MKSSNKSSILTGTILLLVAALFSFSLILQFLDFGIGGPGHNNLLYVLGNIIYTVYGFCSILIPLFLLLAGLSCFATKWTSQKTMRLLTAIIPFFTAVLTEKICRSILEIGPNNSASIKMIITLITGLMLIVIEILGAGVIAESVNQKLFYSKGKSKATLHEEDYDSSEFEDSNKKSENSESYEYNPIKKSSAFDKALSEISITPAPVVPAETKVAAPVQTVTPVQATVEVPAAATEVSVEAPAELHVTAPVESAEETIDEDIAAVEGLEEEEIAALENIKSKNLTSEEILAEDSEEDPEDADDESFDSLLKEAEELYEEDVPSIEDYEAIDTAESAEENTETVETPVEAATPAANTEEEEEPANPASIITQEEYAALINPEANFAETEEPEELEWPDLPPVPETLPPEYIDEDDPAFDFPPAEEVEESEETVEISKDASIDEESPYSAGKYVDSVVHPNPAYPIGITIHDEEVEKEPVKKTVYEAPKYPSKISLSDSKDNYEQISSPVTYESVVTEDEEEDLEDDYVEDVTLPEPDYFNMNEPTLGESFATDINDYFEEEYIEDEPEEIKEEKTPVSSLYEQSNPQNQTTFSSSISSVFDDMDADIRKKYGLDDSENQYSSDDVTIEAEEVVDITGTATEPAYNDFADDTIEEEEPVIEEQSVTEEEVFETEANSFADLSESESPELNPNANSAKNLTADELSDFFNAQQAENTPVTKEIQGNPVQEGHRAVKKGPYVIPSDLLTAYKDDQYWIIDDETKQASLNLKQTLSEFGIEADIIGIKKGPVVTMFEILPAPGVKLSKIVALQDNIALSLAAQSVRIVAPIPGKQAVGIEVPNRHRSVVGFREIIEMDLPEWEKMAVPVILGKDILGKAQLIDLTKTPHMLIAGATGSGKSVCVNSLILSILYKRSYKDVKLILVDPKVVELKLYNNIPHLLSPVITEPKKALAALQYCLCEMERRYSLLDGLGVRDISSYNRKIKERNICTEKLPYIVVIIDEFADLMATSGKELESTVARLTAMSRAVGIHLVLATQRPSVNVITGLIKANIPSRIAFMVASRTDSNIIIDSVGAEKLLGRGDMLYASAVDPAPNRIQGTFVSDQEVENVVNAVKEYGEPDYVDEELMFGSNDEDENAGVDLFGNDMGEDPLYDQALEIVVQAGKASASYIQRRLKIGYNRAARLVEEMEERGIVGPANGSKPREIIHIP